MPSVETKVDLENLQPIHFFDDPIQPIFDSPPAREKTPDCPDGFIWNDRAYRVAEMLSSWSDFTRRGKMAHTREVVPPLADETPPDRTSKPGGTR